MYKVFFNDSSIQIGSDGKKSLKNNILPEPDLVDFISVNQFVETVESSKSSVHYRVSEGETDAFWKYFRSCFTEMPAAGGLVRNLNGALLFIRRLGYWDLPKGKIEQNESAESAALREVEEECGISGLKPIRPLDSTFHIYRSPFLPAESNLVLKETKWFLMEYSGNEKPVPQTEEDIVEVRWVNPEEIEEVMKNTYSSLREFLGKMLPVI